MEGEVSDEKYNDSGFDLDKAHIQTMDDSLPSAQAFAVAGGRITALGTDDEILSLRGPQTEIHDLEGHFVYPRIYRRPYAPSDVW